MYFFYFEQVLPEGEYEHFLMLFVAARIVSCNIYSPYLPIASKLFKMYVERYESLYGRHNIGSNVHNLVHIIEDMENCNVTNLIELSTYSYENTLRMIGLKLKHTNRPLEQVVCRTIEQNKLESHAQLNASHVDQHIQFKPKVFYEFTFQNIKVYKKIKFAPNLILSSRNDNNSWFLTRNLSTNTKDIVKLEFVRIHHLNNGVQIKLYGKKIKTKESFFKNPINSIKLDIYQSDIELENESVSRKRSV